MEGGGKIANASTNWRNGVADHCFNNSFAFWG